MTEKAEVLSGENQEKSTASSRAMTLRPTRSDDAVLAKAIDAILPEIEEWASGEDVSDARSILREALRWGSRDGYELARAFERAGWDVDFQLADILNNADCKLYSAEKAAVDAWIIASRTRPKLSVGTHVVLPEGQSDAGTKGEIVRIDGKAGTYVVFCESLGHVKDGWSGRVFAWEHLERANSPESATAGFPDV